MEMSSDWVLGEKSTIASWLGMCLKKHMMFVKERGANVIIIIIRDFMSCYREGDDVEKEERLIIGL